MKILLTKVGKRFNRDWIFRHLDYEFLPGSSYAITGPNGSGKSTLLQVIAGSTACTEGKIQYSSSSSEILDPATIYNYLSISAPYLELVEEMTLLEFLRFHQRFKPFLDSFQPEEIASRVGLQHSLQKQIRYFSSGMKQRIKLAQALFSKSDMLLLDEPCTNLDEEGIALYRRLVNEFRHQRLVIVSSNDRQEYDFCEHRLSVTDFKNV